MTARSVVTMAFWRGFPALLLTFMVAQLSPQIDLALLARSVDGAASAYVVVLRLAMLETVANMALGSVASVAASRASIGDAAAPEVRGALWLAVLIGCVFAVFGMLAYVPAIPWVAGGDAAIGAQAAAAAPWFAAASPFRTLGGTSAFLLHALGRGGMVVRWKMAEVTARAGLGLLIIDHVAPGASGCFVAGLLVNALSACWGLLALRSAAMGWRPPERHWVGRRLRSAAWEAQRMLSFNFLGLTTLALYASPIGGDAVRERLGAYSAATIMALMLFSPLIALMRFLAMRFSRSPPTDLFTAIRSLLVIGVPLGALAGLILAIAADGLGRRVYGQSGPWWWALALALAFSLPWRVAGNTLRAAIQSRDGFAGVARLDSLCGWLIGLPVTAFGLWWDLPFVACSSLLLPELVAVAWLGSRVVRHARGETARKAIVSLAP